MRINFDFADLEAFLVLSETGSFTAAARHLGLSQSALTRRIRKLEEATGTPLFERTTRAVRATLAGKRFRGRAQALLDDARETLAGMQDETARFAYQHRAIVTLAAVPSAIPRLVLPAAGLFATGADSARVRLLDLLANEVAEAVAGGRADFGISSLPVMEDQIAFTPLAEDRVVLVMPRDHPLAREGTVRWERLRGQRLILPLQGSGNRALIDQALAPAGLSLFWTFEVPRSSTALELVRAGLGLAAMPLSAVPIGEASTLTAAALVAPEIRRQIGIVTRRGTALSAAARILHDLIVSEAARHSDP